MHEFLVQRNSASVKAVEGITNCSSRGSLSRPADRATHRKSRGFRANLGFGRGFRLVLGLAVLSFCTYQAVQQPSSIAAADSPIQAGSAHGYSADWVDVIIDIITGGTGGTGGDSGGGTKP